MIPLNEKEVECFATIDFFRHHSGGEGMDAGQGVESTQFERWRDDYDPDCPTELLVDVEEIAAYEFNYTAIQKWLPWVEVNV